jgi:hypothetical protein
VPHLLYRVAPKNAPELMLNTWRHRPVYGRIHVRQTIVNYVTSESCMSGIICCLPATIVEKKIQRGPKQMSTPVPYTYRSPIRSQLPCNQKAV